MWSVLASICRPVPSCPDPGRHTRHSPYVHVNTAGMVAALRHPPSPTRRPPPAIRHPSPRDQPSPAAPGRRLPHRCRPWSAQRVGSPALHAGELRRLELPGVVGRGRRRTRLGGGRSPPARSPPPSGVTTAARAGLPRSPEAAFPAGSAPVSGGSGTGQFAPSPAEAAGAGRVHRVSGRRPQGASRPRPASQASLSPQVVGGGIVPPLRVGGSRCPRPMRHPTLCLSHRLKRPTAQQHHDTPTHPSTGTSVSLGTRVQGADAPGERPTAFVPAPPPHSEAAAGACGGDSPARDLIPIRKGTRI